MISYILECFLFNVMLKFKHVFDTVESLYNEFVDLIVRNFPIFGSQLIIFLCYEECITRKIV